MLRIVRKTKSYYENNNLLYGSGSPKNLWIDQKRQDVRFDKAKELFDFNGKTIFDVGCGYGDFYHYLLKNKLSIKQYDGIELLDEHSLVAKKSLPKFCNIYSGDFLEHKTQSYDCFVLSGTLNFYSDGWKEMAIKIIDKMWKYSKQAIIFNMRSNFDTTGNIQKDISPDFWCNYAFMKTKNFSLHHDYLENDYTIIMYKTEQE